MVVEVIFLCSNYSSFKKCNYDHPVKNVDVKFYDATLSVIMLPNNIIYYVKLAKIIIKKHDFIKNLNDNHKKKITLTVIILIIKNFSDFGEINPRK